ncbi:MAG: hypothetical protein ACRYG5_02710 [Janthinobacterium lividum]
MRQRSSDQRDGEPAPLSAGSRRLQRAFRKQSLMRRAAVDRAALVRSMLESARTSAEPQRSQGWQAWRGLWSKRSTTRSGRNAVRLYTALRALTSLATKSVAGGQRLKQAGHVARASAVAVSGLEAWKLWRRVRPRRQRQKPELIAAPETHDD